MSEEHGVSRSTGEHRQDNIDFDDLFDLLSQRRRRYALYCFSEATRSEFSVSALVDRLAAIEREASTEGGERKDIELSLRHAHLPKLAEASIVEYDPDDAVVEYRGGTRVERWIDMAANAELDGNQP